MKIRTFHKNQRWKRLNSSKFTLSVDLSISVDFLIWYPQYEWFTDFNISLCDTMYEL